MNLDAVYRLMETLLALSCFTAAAEAFCGESGREGVRFLAGLGVTAGLLRTALELAKSL